MARVISFCGPDGAGKSTQVDLLSETIPETADVRTARPIYILVELFGLRRFATSSTSPRKQVKNDGSGLGRLVTLIVAIPYLFATTIYLHLHPTDVIICDRYIYQTLFDCYGRKAKYILPLFPKPDCGFLLNPELDLLLQRMDAADSDVSGSYYEDVREFYDETGERVGLVELDASDDPESIHNSVRTHLCGKINEV